MHQRAAAYDAHGHPNPRRAVKFYLGSSHPNWLADPRFCDVPLFVSHRSLRRYRTPPRALGDWALDSGGFTELSLHGRWTLPAADYARAVLRYRDEVGRMDWASPQDWMCEPEMLAKTGLTVAEHQRRTVASVLELRALGAPVIPVLQGWAVREYHTHVEDYDRAGIDLRAEPIVGLGSVCRRQATAEAARLVRTLASLGLRLHGFGFNLGGLPAVHRELVSSDSMAWSKGARYGVLLPGCVGVHKTCNNCPIYALQWGRQVVATLDRLAARHHAYSRGNPPQKCLFSEVT